MVASPVIRINCYLVLRDAVISKASLAVARDKQVDKLRIENYEVAVLPNAQGDGAPRAEG